MLNKKKDNEFEDHFGQPKKNRVLSFIKVAGFSILVIFSAGSTLAIIAQKNNIPAAQVEPSSAPTSLAAVPTSAPTPSCKYSEFTPETITSAVNEYRIGKGKPQLLVSTSLAKFAQLQAEALAPTDKSKLGADTKLPNFYDWQTSKIKSAEQVNLTEYNVVWNWDQGSVCDFVGAFSQTPQVDQTVLKAEHDTIGAGFKDAFIFVAIGSRETAAQAAEANRQAKAAYDDSRKSALATGEALRQQADRSRQAYEETKARNEAAEAERKEQDEKKTMQRYAMVLLAVAADSANASHSSVSSSDTGFTSLSGYDTVSSASNSKFGFISFSFSGKYLSSMSSSKLGFYSCSYSGEDLSSCSGSGQFITFSSYKGSISSASSSAGFVSFSGYKGISSASASGDFYTVN